MSDREGGRVHHNGPTLPKGHSTYKNLSVSWEATPSASVLVIASILGIFGGAVHCYEYARCHDAGTCMNASRWRTMKFSQFYQLRISGWRRLAWQCQCKRLFKTDLRACAPGERLHINSVTGSTECAPWRSWPSALNAEIMQLGAADKHDRSAAHGCRDPRCCSVEYWSFYTRLTPMLPLSAETATYLDAVGRQDMEILCRLPASHLVGQRCDPRFRKRRIRSPQGCVGVHTVQDVMEAVYWLASHYCDGPVRWAPPCTRQSTQRSRTQLFSTGTLAAQSVMDEDLHFQTLAGGNSILNANAMSSSRRDDAGTRLAI